LRQDLAMAKKTLNLHLNIQAAHILRQLKFLDSKKPMTAMSRGRPVCIQRGFEQ